MRFYLLDDDRNILKMAANLIEDYGLGHVIGMATNPKEAFEELKSLQPDICIVDLLMPGMNGNTFIKKAKESHRHISFIMISQVSSDDMISEAYEKGASFYIHKPINVIEFRSVIQSVSEKITMQRTLDSIKGVLGRSIEMPMAQPKKPVIKDQFNKNLQKILGNLGILGEKGTYDLITVCEALKGTGNWKESQINDIIRQLGQEPKIVKQRMRRALSKALTNIAHSGIEDYLGEHFIRYAHSLFDFQSVKEEMDYLRGKRKKGGKVSLTRFIEAILLMADEMTY